VPLAPAPAPSPPPLPPLSLHDALPIFRAALEARKSARGFHPAEVPPDDLRALFAMAQRAPSWCNIQPWHVWVTGGEATAKLSARSEEHTSELQSRENLVCRLLLEKKNQ